MTIQMSVLPNQLLKINIKPMILIDVTSKMFAYRRIINENGLMKTPNNSIGANTISILAPWHPENMTPIVLLAVRFVLKTSLRLTQT
jgi:hypothetical protein